MFLRALEEKELGLKNKTNTDWNDINMVSVMAL